MDSFAVKMDAEEYTISVLSTAYIQLSQRKYPYDISVNEICQMAGVSRSSFYRIFEKRDYQKELYLFYATRLLEPYFARATTKEKAVEALLRFAYWKRDFVVLSLNEFKPFFLTLIYEKAKELGEAGYLLPSLVIDIENLAKDYFNSDFEEELSKINAKLGLNC